ncbi:MAG TPA: GntR family transcriptional regulator [Longimicrobiales bacterium]|nr:GntR family transcriptional regulator [Longimicrobiales bacterium]
MHFHYPLVRQNLTDQVADAIRQMIVSGELPDGQRINESHLAAALDVSRTPLREALGRLVNEGSLYNVPRIGYFVSPLTVDELQQLYPIRAMLDPEALRLAGIPSAEVLKRLEELNREILTAADVPAKIDADDQWHLILVSMCPNKVLVGLIDQFIRRTRRYELALFREAGNVSVSTNHHERIVRALRAGNLEEACEVLRQNLSGGVEPLIHWLQSR